MSTMFEIFLAVILFGSAIIYVIPHKLRRYFVLCISLFFFYVNGLSTLIFAVCVVGLGYLFSFLVDKYHNKLCLTAGIISVFCVLFIIKYVFTWTISGWVIPCGLSYYTLMVVGNFIEIYRKKEQWEKNVVDYSLFLTFFPQVMAGPIGRSKDLLRQWRKGVTFDSKNYSTGFLMLLFGIVQKFVVADQLSQITGAVFENVSKLSGWYITVAVLFYALQIYFDFAGYSLIAIGGAKMFGIELMENFNAPYKALSIKEFWRRWHISLSSWFKDYLYIPLGGSRVAPLRIDFNVMIVFIMSGIWHGAYFGFALWGLIHGLYQIVGRHTEPIRQKIRDKLHLSGFVYEMFRRICVFLLVALAFLPFRVNHLDQMVLVVRNWFVWNPEIVVNGSLLGFGVRIEDYILVGLLVLISFLLESKHKVTYWFEKVASFSFAIRWIIYVILITLYLCAGVYGGAYQASDFIYGQF